MSKISFWLLWCLVVGPARLFQSYLLDKYFGNATCTLPDYHSRIVKFVSFCSVWCCCLLPSKICHQIIDLSYYSAAIENPSNKVTCKFAVRVVAVCDVAAMRAHLGNDRRGIFSNGRRLL